MRVKANAARKSRMENCQMPRCRRAWAGVWSAGRRLHGPAIRDPHRPAIPPWHTAAVEAHGLLSQPQRGGSRVPARRADGRSSAKLATQRRPHVRSEDAATRRSAASDREVLARLGPFDLTGHDSLAPRATKHGINPVEHGKNALPAVVEETSLSQKNIQINSAHPRGSQPFLHQVAHGPADSSGTCPAKGRMDG